MTFRFILFILFTIVALVLALLGTKTVATGTGRNRVEDTISFRKWAPLAAAFALLFLVWSCFRIVPANSVGIPTTFGSIGKPVRPGLKPVMPLTEMHTFSTRFQEDNMLLKGDNGNDDSIGVRGNDGYAMQVDVTVRFSVRSEAASDLYRRVGSMERIKNGLVRPEAREGIRLVFSRYTAEDGYSTQREKISVDANDEMRRRLDRYGLDLDQVNIRGVVPEPRLAEAIGRRADAREDALKAKIEGDKAVTEAESRKQVALRDAEARATSSQAEADANARVNASLTPSVLRAREIEALSKAGTVYVPYGSDLFVDGRRQPAP